MAYDEHLATRVRKHLQAHPGFAERRMFGGICFLLNGHMTAGVLRSSLILRIGVEAHQDALTHPHVREFDFTGRPSKGVVYVDPPALATDHALASWLDRSVAVAVTLPPKHKPAKSRAPSKRGPRKTKKSR